jgi:hypothetical protein
MYPFPDYYAQFGIILKNTSFVPLGYEIHEEAICIIIFLFLLGIEIFISIVQVLSDSMKMKGKIDNHDLIESLYQQQIDTSEATIKTHSTIEQTTNEGAFLLLDKPISTSSEKTTEF